MREDSIERLTKIAADPSTPSHLLIELGKHENSQIRSLVASNPNTLLETLESLGTEYADAIVENPAFELLKLENPNSKFIQLTLARSTKTSPKVLAKLIATKDLDGENCRTVAKNINTPIDALASLAITLVEEKDVYTVVYNDYIVSHWFELALDIIRRPDIPESCLEKVIDIFIERNYEYLLRESATIPNLPFKVLEKLSTYPSKYPDRGYDNLLGACEELLIDVPLVQKSPILLDNVARNIVGQLRHKEDMLLKIAHNPLTLSSTIEYLAAHYSPQIRNALLNHPHVSPKALEISLFAQIKAGTPIELLHEIAEDPRFYSATLLCLYPNVPSEIMDKVYDHLPSYARDVSYRQQILQCLAYHPNSSLNLLQKIRHELDRVSTSISRRVRYYQGGYINGHLLKEINNLAEKVNQRIEGENFAETNQLSAYWSLFEDTPSESAIRITNQMRLKRGGYSWNNYSLPDPKG